MVNQYIIEYARETTPLNFDTPAFRKLLQMLESYCADEDEIDETGKRFLYLERTVAHDLPNGSVAFLPPEFEQNEERNIYAEMYVWCVDAQTSNSKETLRFIEFATKYLDPVYTCYLSPCEYESISSTETTAQRVIWEKAYQQALTSTSKNAETVRLALLADIQSLNEAPPLLSGQIFDFYHQEVVPRLRLLFGGMYFDMEVEIWGSGNNTFEAIWGVIEGEMTIAEAIRLLNQQAIQEFALWH